MSVYVDTPTVTTLTGEYKRRIHEKVEDGLYRAVRRGGKRGGSSGESYLIDVTTLPIEAQILYLQSMGALGVTVSGADLVAYKEKYENEGVRELLAKQQAVLAGIAARTMGGAELGAKIDALAEGQGVDRRTLERWIKNYQERGLAGIMKAIKRSDKGESKSLCLFAQDFIRAEYLDEVKRTQQRVYTKLCQYAADEGANACVRCPYNAGTDMRDELCTSERPLPLCDEPVRQGLVIPAHRSAINRFVARISGGEKAMGRHGEECPNDRAK